jgi:aldose 1-epimerase
MRIGYAAAAVLLALAATASAQAKVVVQAWGGLGPDHRDPVFLYTLTNARGMEVKLTNYGAVIVSVTVPGRDGTRANVVQGFSSLQDYISPGYSGRYGAIIGRYAGGIKNNRFMIDNIHYHIGADEYGVDPHSRRNRPYDQRLWSAGIDNGAVDGPEPEVVFNLVDYANTMGFPGNVHVKVTYTLTRNNVLRIDYHATTDKKTPISLTNHAYFNMAGDTSGSVLDQLLTVNADAITEVDGQNVPTGVIRPVAGTGFDFRAPTPISAHINDPDPAIRRAGGIDQNYVIRGKPGTLRLAARLQDPKSGRTMEEWTTQAGLQVYTGNYQPPPVAMAKGYAVHSGVALEAQGFPNAPNIPTFPSTLLERGDSLDEVTEYRFSVR